MSRQADPPVDQRVEHRSDSRGGSGASRRAGRRAGRRVTAGDAARATSRATGELMLTAGALVLLFVVWQLWWTGIGAGHDRRSIASSLSSSWPVPHARAAAEAPPAPGDPPVVAEPSTGTAFAIVHVPRFGPGWSVPEEEGVDVRAVLDHGVLGHYPGTAMPGGLGNFAMAGHRTTYGHPMNQIAELVAGDPIVVETADAWYVYQVSGHEVVAPSDVGVIAPVAGSPGATPVRRTLTITACHPEYSARQRYVVHATMVSWQPRSAGEPAALVQAGG